MNHDFENMKINKFNFLLNKEIQGNFCTCNLAHSSCHTRNKRMPKRPVIEIRYTKIASLN